MQPNLFTTVPHLNYLFMWRHPTGFKTDLSKLLQVSFTYLFTGLKQVSFVSLETFLAGFTEECLDTKLCAFGHTI